MKKIIFCFIAMMGVLTLSAQTVNPMFTYTCIHEENEKWEYRYYFDDSGRCIETKSTDHETDGGKDDKETTRRFMFVFNTIMEK